MRTLVSTAMLALVLALGCGGPARESARSLARPRGADCTDVTEPAALRCAGSRASRHGARLHILVAGNRTVVLQDVPTDGAEFVHHEYAGRLGRIGAHLVRVEPAMEFSLAPEDWGPSDPVWLDDSTIEFRKNVPTEDDPNSYRVERARLIREGGTWRLAGPTP